MHLSPRPRRRLPEWLIGFLLALVVVAVGYFVATGLGAGDDPTFEGGESSVLQLW